MFPRRYLLRLRAQQKVEASWRSERDAGLADAQRSDVAEEDRAWQEALADGLD
jgi:hypothetical protein